MNKKLIVLVVGLALLMTAGASAQTIHLKTDVPFKFIVGRTTFPAGQYELLSTGIGDNVLMIRSLNSKDAALVLSNLSESREVSAQTKLVFHRYGQRYFLAEVWMIGDNASRRVQASSWEVEVAKDFSMEKVVLLAKRD
jgi:hypothetical protein